MTTSTEADVVAALGRIADILEKQHEVLEQILQRLANIDDQGVFTWPGTA